MKYEIYLGTLGYRMADVEYAITGGEPAYTEGRSDQWEPAEGYEVTVTKVEVLGIGNVVGFMEDTGDIEQACIEDYERNR